MSYTPSQLDVFSVRIFLLRFVPAELAVIITSLAEYWPKVTSIREALTGPASLESATEGGEWCYVLSPPVPYFPGLLIKPRKIRFVIECSAECAYDSISSNYTQFHAAVIKSSDVAQNIALEPLEYYPERQIHSWNITDPRRWLVQDVPLSWTEGTRKELVWDEEQAEADSRIGPGSLLRSLASGDRVAVMVQGLIPGWMNCIYDVTAEVYYST